MSRTKIGGGLTPAADTTTLEIRIEETQQQILPESSGNTLLLEPNPSYWNSQGSRRFPNGIFSIAQGVKIGLDDSFADLVQKNSISDLMTTCFKAITGEEIDGISPERAEALLVHLARRQPQAFYDQMTIYEKSTQQLWGVAYVKSRYIVAKFDEEVRAKLALKRLIAYVQNPARTLSDTACQAIASLGAKAMPAFLELADGLEKLSGDELSNRVNCLQMCFSGDKVQEFTLGERIQVWNKAESLFLSTRFEHHRAAVSLVRTLFSPLPVEVAVSLIPIIVDERISIGVRLALVDLLSKQTFGVAEVEILISQAIKNSKNGSPNVQKVFCPLFFPKIAACDPDADLLTLADAIQSDFATEKTPKNRYPLFRILFPELESQFVEKMKASSLHEDLHCSIVALSLLAEQARPLAPDSQAVHRFDGMLKKLLAQVARDDPSSEAWMTICEFSAQTLVDHPEILPLVLRGMMNDIAEAALETKNKSSKDQRTDQEQRVDACLAAIGKWIDQGVQSEQIQKTLDLIVTDDKNWVTKIAALKAKLSSPQTVVSTK